jgi:hypothetical protein
MSHASSVLAAKRLGTKDKKMPASKMQRQAEFMVTKMMIARRTA